MLYLFNLIWDIICGGKRDKDDEFIYLQDWDMEEPMYGQFIYLD